MKWLARTRSSTRRSSAKSSPRWPAPGAVANAKTLIRFVATHDARANLDYTVTALADAWETAEIREGIDAFMKKRKPNWQQ